MARVIGIQDATGQTQTIYDPTCGSGSLLLKAHDEAPGGVTIYGQEKDIATRALSRMNMILHDCPTAEIAGGSSTLAKPLFTDGQGKLQRFDFVVANPPFSTKAWSQGLPEKDPFNRFELGRPPEKNGDYAFLLHILASMKSTAKSAVILPHGVLFRGNAEADIRRAIVRRGYIKGIIGLPANLFYGTGIPACILVLDKEGADTRTGIFMIDASKGFTKVGPKNRLREQDIHRIVDTLTKGADVPKYARLVQNEEIEGHDYNLNIPRYIDASEPEDRQDIEGHLKGGIPARDVEALDKFWAIMPGVKEALFAPDRPNYLTPRVEPDDMRAAIEAHEEFNAYRARVADLFKGWRTATRPKLTAFDQGHLPKALIHDIAEDLLARFAKADLIDKYDVYQLLMSYWGGTLQDDAYILATEGWGAGNVMRTLIKDKDGKYMEEPDLTLGTGKSAKKLKAELIPPALIIARYFPDQQAKIDAATERAEALQAQMDELIEEHGGDEGALETLDVGKKGPSQKALDDLLDELSTAALSPHKPALLAEITEAKSQLVDALNARREADLTCGEYEKAKSAKGKLGKKSITARLETPDLPQTEAAALRSWLECDANRANAQKELKSLFAERDEWLGSAFAQDHATEEFQALSIANKLISLNKDASIAANEAKALQAALDTAVVNHYPKLSIEEIKALTVDDKWLARIEADVMGELDRVSQALTTRVKTLAARYRTPLARLETRVEALSAKVEEHLAAMGDAA